MPSVNPLLKYQNFTYQNFSLKIYYFKYVECKKNLAVTSFGKLLNLELYRAILNCELYVQTATTRGRKTICKIKDMH